MRQYCVSPANERASYEGVLMCTHVSACAVLAQDNVSPSMRLTLEPLKRHVLGLSCRHTSPTVKSLHCLEGLK